MPKLAGNINVTAYLSGAAPSSERFTLTIDGEEFPWHITEQGVSVEVNNTDIPAITITIPAENVTLEHRIDDPRGSN